MSDKIYAISAEEAREISSNARKAASEEQLHEIFKNIMAAAEEGLFIIFVHEDIFDENVTLLQELGYKITTLNTFNPDRPAYTIEWKEVQEG